jgi:pimeloyl-ACP methyl ester carboxylesterase
MTTPPANHRRNNTMITRAMIIHAFGLLILLSWATASVNAEQVTLQMPSGIGANAEYLQGEPGRPTILMLHGFLQTHSFHTIHQLSQGLHDEGYTVLSPTLTLGIPYRRQSLACEAIHTHQLADIHAEIGAWMDWLENRQQRDIVFIGHSTGSVNLLSYLSNHPDARVKKLIGISIVEGRLELDANAQQALQQQLLARINNGDKQPIKQNYSYCRPITATPASLYSYMVWTPQRILATIQQLSTPQAYLMGSMDDRLGPGWIPQLSATGRSVTVIDGANHFMDGEFEFALQDAVLEQLP